MRTISLRGTSLFVIGTMLIMSHRSPAADFPEIDKLPSHKELPDPLMMFDGTPVTTREQWTDRRAPELKALFQHYMYGEIPAAPKISATVQSADRDAVGGKATMKQIRIALSSAPDCPAVNLLLFVPNHRDANRPPPVVLGLNFSGDHTVLDDRRIALAEGWMAAGPEVEHNRATDAGRGKDSDRWQVEHVIDRGFALATFYYGDVAPDHPGFKDGVFPFFLKAGQTEHGPNDWGAIAAWAWGLQRAVDYLVTDTDVDPKRIVVFGHSRTERLPLLAGALDDGSPSLFRIKRVAVARPPAGKTIRRRSPSAGSTNRFRIGSMRDSKSSAATKRSCPSTRIASSPFVRRAGALHLRRRRQMGQSAGTTRRAKIGHGCLPPLWQGRDRPGRLRRKRQTHRRRPQLLHPQSTAHRRSYLLGRLSRLRRIVAGWQSTLIRSRRGSMSSNSECGLPIGS